MKLILNKDGNQSYDEFSFIFKACEPLLIQTSCVLDFPPPAVLNWKQRTSRP